MRPLIPPPISPLSMRLRAVLALSLLITALWLAAAAITQHILTREMDEVFDSALQETGQRVLQLAVIDVLNREEEGLAQIVTPLDAHTEFFTYVVRDGLGRVLLASHNAEAALFPVQSEDGFFNAGDLRFYRESAVQGTITLTIAEPLAHRRDIARELGLGLILPLLAMIPLSILGIAWGMGLALRPLRALRRQLAAQGAQSLAPLPLDGLPSELRPIAETTNQLFARLSAAFDAERSFASNAAHELRTPLAGAIAQVQRLRSQSGEPETLRRAGEVEATLQRLTRLTERLMQLARAEGARLVLDAPQDCRAVIGLIAEDFIRSDGGAGLALVLPDAPVLSRLDPDAIAIALRNLIENARRHGADGTASVTLRADGWLVVDNPCPPLPADVLAGLTKRFARANMASSGAGLGLSIAGTIANRTGAALVLSSPIPNTDAGFRASLHLGVAAQNAAPFQFP